MIDENSSISWRNQHGTFGIHYIGNYGLQGTPRENHQAVLVDVFFGIDVKGNLEDVFAEEAYDIDKAAEYMHSFDAGLNEMIASRRRFSDRTYWNSARQRMLFSLPCMAQTERTERYRLRSICSAFRIPERAI